MNLDIIKQRLNIDATDTTYDTALEYLWNSCVALFTNMTGLLLSPITDKTITFRDIYSSDTFYINEGPITSITSVLLDGVEITDYDLEEDAIYFNTPIKGKKLVITYNAGYTTIPVSIEDLLIQLLIYLHAQDGVSNYLPSTGKTQLTPNANNIPAYIKEQIYGYKI